MAVTATATSKVYRDVISLLSLKHDAQTIAVLPDRPNIFIHMQCVKENHAEAFSWVIDHVKSNGVRSKKMIIYTNRVKACQTIFHSLREELGNNAFVDAKRCREKHPH